MPAEIKFSKKVPHPNVLLCIGRQFWTARDREGQVGLQPGQGVAGQPLRPGQRVAGQPLRPALPRKNLAEKRARDQGPGGTGHQ